MTLKESLFNKGIYLNTLRRFKWGSLLYFIVLFLSAPFVFLTSTQDNILHTRFQNDLDTFLLEDVSLAIPVVLALLVPTVVALMVFKFIHSQKQGIFVHSLPVSRSANYISTLLGAFTLMALPVVLTGIILIIMSFLAYNIVIGVQASLIWTGINLCVLFIMFSVSAFAAFLTGNSFAMIAINAILYVLPAVSSLMLDALGRKFFYGYTKSDVLEKLLELSPPVWLVTELFDGEPVEFFAKSGTWFYILFAALIYIFAYLLYRKRKIELCGDVAGFYIMKPILKYTVTAVSAVLCFASIGFLEIGVIARIFVTVIICGVVYFACEMVLRKSMRVFGSYKGFCAFSAVCAAVLCFTAFTNIFGFETYVPKAEDVKMAGVYSYYYENVVPSVTDTEGINTVIANHRKILKSIPVTEKEEYADQNVLKIEYELKNGRTVMRKYFLNAELCDSIFSEMFEFNEYKENFFQISTLNIKNITTAKLATNFGDVRFEQFVNSDADKLFNVLNEDIKALTYENYKKSYQPAYEISKELTQEDNEKYKVFKQTHPNERYYSCYFNIWITPEFKNTVAFINEKDYYNSARNDFALKTYITDKPFENYMSSSEKSMATEYIPAENLVKLNEEDAANLIDEISQKPYEKNVFGERYYVFCTNNNNVNQYIGSHCFSFTKDELHENLKKYITN